MEKQEAYDKARELLVTDDEASLRYAALELRRCIEAVVYEKLWAYRDRIPAEVARKWQPPQAFRALLVLEPDAAHTATYRFAQEDQFGVAPSGPYQTLGTDHRPEPNWLTRTYNKIGALLHATWPFARNPSPFDSETAGEYLRTVANELEPFVTHTFTATFATTTEFSCIECGTTVKANAERLAVAGQLECLNPDCCCHYTVTREGDQFTFRLDALHLDCEQCGADIRLPTHRLRQDFPFACPACSTPYRIMKQVWEVGRLPQT